MYKASEFFKLNWTYLFNKQVETQLNINRLYDKDNSFIDLPAFFIYSSDNSMNRKISKSFFRIRFEILVILVWL